MDKMNHVHLMAGIPDWLYYSSIVIIMLISFLLLEIFGKRKTAISDRYKIELTRFKWIKWIFKSRGFQVFNQALLVILFFIILFAGFYGNPLPGENIAPSLTWNIWWIGLMFLILFFGKIWCYACPWDAITSWLTRLSFFKVKKNLINLNWKWPRYLKNIYLATFFFIILTWIELGYHVTLSPEGTAGLGLLMLGLVFLPGLLFEKKSFCRYGCLIGRISGLYAMFSPVEIRNRDQNICNNCDTADCLKGNDQGYPCPTGQYLKTMDRNTYCIMCAECFRSCPYDNVAFNIRSFGRDLIDMTKSGKDEAYLAITLFSLTAFHGLTMTPVWKKFVQGIGAAMDINSISAFTLGMILCLILPFLVYSMFVWISKKWADGPNSSHKYSVYFVKYAYGLITIALFYHLAHNVEHFFMESQKVYVLVSDPFGYDWNLFGTAKLMPQPLLSLQTIWYIQVVLIITGHVFGIYISHKHGYELFEDRRSAIKSQIPMICLMVLFSVLSLWLVAQPMEMRTAM